MIHFSLILKFYGQLYKDDTTLNDDKISGMEDVVDAGEFHGLAQSDEGPGTIGSFSSIDEQANDAVQEELLDFSDDSLLSGLSDFLQSDFDEITQQSEEKTNFELLVFHACPLSCKVSAILTMAFINRHQLTRRAANDLITLLIAHFPTGHQSFTSLYTLRKRFAKMVGKQPEGCVVRYCKQCHTILNETSHCQACSEKPSVGEYLQLDVQHQIQQLFRGKYYCYHKIPVLLSHLAFSFRSMFYITSTGEIYILEGW